MPSSTTALLHLMAKCAVNVVICNPVLYNRIALWERAFRQRKIRFVFGGRASWMLVNAAMLVYNVMSSSEIMVADVAGELLEVNYD